VAQKRAINTESPQLGAVVSDSLDAALAGDFATIAEVRTILTERANGNISVWLAIDDWNSKEVRSRVFDKQLELMDSFPETNFDFNLIPFMNRSLKELASGAHLIYQRA
jgi:hypothetical protein